MVMYLGQCADLHMAQLMPLPLTISCSSKSRLVLPSWFYLSGVISPRQSWTKSKSAVKQLCVCVCVRVFHSGSIVLNDVPLTLLSTTFMLRAIFQTDLDWPHCSLSTYSLWAPLGWMTQDSVPLCGLGVPSSFQTSEHWPQTRKNHSLA